jgi:hypothetical protein
MRARPVQEIHLNLTGSFTPINLPDCYTKVAELVFYKVANREFKHDHELEDWFEAERKFKETITIHHH